MNPEMRMYDLTPLTLKVSAQRRTVVWGFDLSRSTAAVLLCTAPFAAIVAAISYSFVGIWGLVPAVLLCVASVWVFTGSQSGGLRTSNLAAIRDRTKQRNNRGRLYVGREPITRRPALNTISVAYMPVDGTSDALAAFR